MKNNLPCAEIKIKAQFYDVDPMEIVWHGNYVKFMEQARCALLDKIGYNYNQMEESGYAWPIVSIQLKYVRPIRFNQEFLVRAQLIEYENRIRIKYIMTDPDTGKKINTAESIQMAINMKTGESLFISPECLIDAVETVMKEDNCYCSQTATSIQ